MSAQYRARKAEPMPDYQFLAGPVSRPSRPASIAQPLYFK
jgi:hypothetical protein